MYSDYKHYPVRVKFVREGMMPITKAEKGDWYDLRCGEDIVLMKGQHMYIPLGVAIELPKNYEAIVAARSSAFKKYGILVANGIGVIDEQYNGDDDEWHLSAYATRDTIIPKNDRICQFRIIEHQPDIIFEYLKDDESLGNENRGGLGSTGAK